MITPRKASPAVNGEPILKSRVERREHRFIYHLDTHE